VTLFGNVLKFFLLTFLLQLREDVKRGMHVENLTEHEVSNAREAMQQLIEVSF
jgi:hypothetical protein